MFKAPRLNLNGLKLDAKKPITPRTQKFLAQHNMKAQIASGFVKLESTSPGGGISMGGKFAQDVEEFNNNKEQYIKKHSL